MRKVNPRLAAGDLSVCVCRKQEWSCSLTSQTEVKLQEPRSSAPKLVGICKDLLCVTAAAQMDRSAGKFSQRI